jgi:chromosome segregation ATPase
MSRFHKVMIIVVVTTVGVWGCSQGESKSTAARHLDRIKALEAKCAALEQECKSATCAREEAEQRVASLEQERSKWMKEAEEMKCVARERDELKQVVAARTTERDAYQGQLLEVRKGIRTLLSRVESSLPNGEGSEQKATMSPRL